MQVLRATRLGGLARSCANPHRTVLHRGLVRVGAGLPGSGTAPQQWWREATGGTTAACATPALAFVRVRCPADDSSERFVQVFLVLHDQEG
jgi:hypothetical protein